LLNDAGAASGTAETRDGGARQTDQSEAGTGVTESYLKPFIAGKTAVHGQSTF